MEFQLPNASGTSRHGQPTRIRYNIPSTAMRRLRLLYIASWSRICSSFDQNSSLSINRGIANSFCWWYGNPILRVCFYLRNTYLKTSTDPSIHDVCTAFYAEL